MNSKNSYHTSSEPAFKPVTMDICYHICLQFTKYFLFAQRLFDRREKRRELNNILPRTVSHGFKASLSFDRPMIPQYRSHDERAWNESAAQTGGGEHRIKARMKQWISSEPLDSIHSTNCTFPYGYRATNIFNVIAKCSSNLRGLFL